MASQESKREIRNLISVILASVLVAFSVAMFMVYKWGPSGNYLVKNVLLSPETIYMLQFDGQTKADINNKLFNIDSVQFSFFNTHLNEFQNLKVSKEQYERFYQLIENDKSIDDEKFMQEEIKQANPAKILIMIKSPNESIASSRGEVIQEVSIEFEADKYRIKLIQKSERVKWVLFYHRDIYQNAIDIFAPQK